jgi:hypothetical protein
MREKVETELAEKQDGTKVRPDSWQVREVGGRPAISWVAEFPDPLSNRTKVQYGVRVRGASTRGDLTATAEPKDYDALRTRLDEILNTLTVK